MLSGPAREDLQTVTGSIRRNAEKIRLMKKSYEGYDELDEREMDSLLETESLEKQSQRKKERVREAAEEKYAPDVRVSSGRRNGFRVPMLLTGSCLLLLCGAFGALKWYEKTQLAVTADTQETIVLSGDPQEELEQISGMTDEEILQKLLEEHDLGAKEGAREVLDGIRLSLTDGVSVVDSLRPYYKDHIIVASSGKYHFVPVRDDMRHNQYLQENLEIRENGEYRYVVDGNVLSYKGIDVSKFQGTIDWQQVAGDGVVFAFIRVGYRGYGEKGTLVADATAEENLKGANEAGIKTGVYFYTQAITEDEAREEARMVLETIAPYRIDCPVVIDVEKVSKAEGRMNALSSAERTKIVRVFCEIIKQAGYRPMVYHNMEMGALLLELDQLEDYDKWFAYYRPEMYYPYAYKIWQYSDKGSVAGISGNVDLNIAFEPVWE